MTNHWVDIKNADVILVMGGNAAEAHPCGFKWVTEAKAHRKARLIVVDPRFTRTASVADFYAPIRTGTDIVFLGGIINYLLTNDKIQHEYVKNYTDFPFIVREDFAFNDGIYSGYNAEKHVYDKSTWDYERGDDGFAKIDPTLQHPRCVYNLLKQHYSRYTPEMVEKTCGTPKDKFLKVCEMLASTSVPGRAGTILYALGWTHHSVGAQMIRTGAMVQLLLGNIGIAGGGMNALRGHSNIQGLTDLGLMSNLLPGYMTLPGESEQDFDAYITKRAAQQLRPNQLSYWKNYRAFHVSFMKSWWGDAATAENNWGFDYLPKLDKSYDLMQAFELMHQGKMNGYILQGFNPLAAAPNKANPDGGVPSSDHVLCRRARLAGEFEPGAPMALAGRTGSGRGEERSGDHVRAVPAHAQGVQGAGRQVSRSDREPDVAVRQSGKSDAGRNGDGIQRQGAGRRDGSERSDEGAPEEGRPAVGLCATEGRRHDVERVLDFLRRVDAGRQPDGPPRQLRPDGHRPDAGLGVGLAGEPAHSVQPGVVRPQRQAVRPDAQANRVERQGLDRGGHSRLQGRRTARKRHGSVHHERGRGRAFLRSRRHERRSIPRALRAVRESAGL